MTNKLNEDYIKDNVDNIILIELHFAKNRSQCDNMLSHVVTLKLLMLSLLFNSFQSFLVLFLSP